MKHIVIIWVCLAIYLNPMKAVAEPDDSKSFSAQIEALLAAHQFDKLEAMASDFHRTEARFPGGGLKLHAFYGALGAVQGEACACGGYESIVPYEEKQAAIKEWMRLQPQSLTARLTMTKLLITYAWKARGHGYANSVTPQQWQLYSDRLAQATAYLKGLNAKDDSQVYSLWVTIGRASGSRKMLDTLYTSATRDYPRYFHFYGARADILQPKWFGAPGELAAYTRSLLISPGGEDGQVAYSVVADSLLTQYKGDTIFTDTGLDWPTLKAAYDVREKRYGLNNSQWNNILNLSFRAHDHESAANALKHVGSDWEKSVWKEKPYFDQAVLWTEK